MMNKDNKLIKGISALVLSAVALTSFANQAPTNPEQNDREGSRKENRDNREGKRNHHRPYIFNSNGMVNLRLLGGVVLAAPANFVVNQTADNLFRAVGENAQVYVALVPKSQTTAYNQLVDFDKQVIEKQQNFYQQKDKKDSPNYQLTVADIAFKQFVQIRDHHRDQMKLHDRHGNDYRDAQGPNVQDSNAQGSNEQATKGFVPDVANKVINKVAAPTDMPKPQVTTLNNDQLNALAQTVLNAGTVKLQATGEVKAEATSFGPHKEVRYDARVTNNGNEITNPYQYVHAVTMDYNQEYNLVAVYYYFGDQPENRQTIAQVESFLDSVKVLHPHFKQMHDKRPAFNAENKAVD